MLKVELIGNLGADAEIKEHQGSKFVTMRIANSTKYKNAEGQDVERTDWVDVTLNNVESKVIPFLKAGTKVFVRGNASLRVYSSPKDRCWKAGLQVAAQEIELCGGQSELVPRELTDPESGTIYKVEKYYQANVDTTKWKKDDFTYLVDRRMNQYQVVKGGWCAPVVQQQEDEESQGKAS